MGGQERIAGVPEAFVEALASQTPESAEMELIALAKQGDTEAFSRLVTRHQHMVYNLAWRFMRDAALAEDMTQEAFLKAYRLLGGFRGDCSFSTWIYRVTASVCISELNRRKRRNEVEFLPIHEKQEIPASREHFDLPDLLRRCIAKLPTRYESVVDLYYFKETPYEEIAKDLHIPMGTLKIWMHRARKQLKSILEKELHIHEKE
jgi:RNA polymerase sigma-70 factor (ECF subfamily)